MCRILEILQSKIVNNIFINIIQLSNHHRRIQVSIKARLNRAEPARQLRLQQTVINSMAIV